MKYTTTTAATANKETLVAALTAAGLPVDGLIATLRTRVVEEEVEEEVAAAPVNGATGAGSITSFDSALNARSFASPNATGAESAPMRTYVFAVDSVGAPKLIGGTWVDGAIVSDKYQPLKGSDNVVLAVQPEYVGKDKTIKFVICDNATGNEYRLSGSAFETAYKAIGQKMTFAAREMSQVVAEVGGYSRATVVLA